MLQVEEVYFYTIGGEFLFVSNDRKLILKTMTKKEYYYVKNNL